MLKWESGNPIRGKRYVVVDINTTLGVLSEAGFDWTEALEAINNG